MKILFVCLGNICRSPAAEGVFLHLLKKRKLEKYFEVDSAGTSGFHSGEPADGRMQQAAQRRGIVLPSRSRPFCFQDLEDFDHIFVMDKSNLRNVLAMAQSDEQAEKVRLFGELATEHSEVEVPDPYYGGEAGFEKVLDMVENAGQTFLKECSEFFSKNS